ncbi:methionine ABC transporter ATP-binding protein [Arthrobacter jiangjiafuii]|uniref:Methionine ABC transporter ATP-binding protein n=1 Tax=Arthrobacter jiangjiafuii TaxID=2817475 RepID=A0A975M7K5_9MICC|nr:methionine ABC transporter ATP-binding protein [Arthrobacter jiangjiafuii]MBP3044423.1 methionine ABC transporter ATP-binding protein [Arthrobacter jiangjiafuii]QWC11367.1 methionine ABC transporter ATP-binding protein [Arthrobacter jiangjiafuii]
MALISLQNVSKTYPPARKGEPAVTALRDINLEIEAGEIFGIIGYSGAGKSTLVRLINALESSTSGDITVDGRQVSGVPERKLRTLRLDIGMIFQQFNLFNSKTVRNNIAYPLRVAGRSTAEIAARVEELLDFVGLADKAGSYPEQLSGGQKQRVGIARALAASPKILLADEATSALDPETTHEVLALLRRVNRELGITIVVITHEMDVIKNLATRVAVMDGGRIVEQGEVFEVFSNPRQASSRKFVSTVVRGVPSPDELDSLRRRHPGRIVTLSFRDGDSSQSEVFLELARAGIGFELVYGGINDISGRAFGHLTLALTGEDAAIDGALAAVGHGLKVAERF